MKCSVGCLLGLMDEYRWMHVVKVLGHLTDFFCIAGLTFSSISKSYHPSIFPCMRMFDWEVLLILTRAADMSEEKKKEVSIVPVSMVYQAHTWTTTEILWRNPILMLQIKDKISSFISRAPFCSEDFGKNIRYSSVTCTPFRPFYTTMLFAEARSEDLKKFLTQELAPM